MNDLNWLAIIGVVVLGAAVFFLASGGNEAPVSQPVLLLAPTADAGVDKVVSECGTVRVGNEAFDPSGGAVSILWTATAGSFDTPYALHPVYTAPSTCGLEDVTLTLTVTNANDVIAQDSLIVHVTDRAPCIPQTACPAPSPCLPHPVCPSPVVPTPRIETHVVTQPCVVPTVVECPPIAQIRVPSGVVQTCGNPCVVPCPPCERRTMCEAISPVRSVIEGGSVHLRGTVWDVDRNLTNYYWTADKGRFDDPSSINPTYCAPMILNPCGEDVVISLNVVDSCGARTASQVILHIQNRH